MRAYILVDLGFGDAGKGLLTDFLVRHLGAGLVVRYNGGAQAGHNVVAPDGRQHTFSQFGAGTFVPGVKTYLSRHVVIHPTALLLEGGALENKGVADAFARLRISDRALVITPFHQAVNRLRELSRGAGRHGSCGVGVGEAVADAISHPETRVLAGDLKDPDLLRRKLGLIRQRKREQARALWGAGLSEAAASEWEIFARQDVIETWIASVYRLVELGLVAPDSLLERWLRETEHVVFEGAQGVLLDEDAGFHPYTTWSRSTPANAFEILREMAPGSPAFRIGVLRSYVVRHGPGPLPTETDEIAALVSEHNRHNPWQGVVRYGWFDAVLARYALNVIGGVDALAVTHLDLLPRLDGWRYCPGYEAYQDLGAGLGGAQISDGLLTSFHLPPSLGLKDRTRFTQALSQVTPAYRICLAEDETVVREIEALTGQPVGLVARGPSAQDVQILDALPA